MKEGAPTRSGNISEIRDKGETRENAGEKNEKSALTKIEAAQKEITSIAEKRDDLNERIFIANKSATETGNQLARVRSELNIDASQTETASSSSRDKEIAKLEEKREKVLEDQEKWLDQHGKENLPNGIVIETKEGMEAKGVSFPLLEQMRREDREEELRERKKFMDVCKEELISTFEMTLRKNWRTKSAVNLDLTIALMKLQVPKAFDEKTKDFVEGKTDMPPFANVYISWKDTPLLARLVGEPNVIQDLKIHFDGEPITIADKEDLEEGLEEKEKSGEKTRAEENNKENNIEKKQAKETRGGAEKSSSASA